MRNTTNKLTGRQLAAMLLIGDVFVLFCFRGGMSALTAAGLSIGIGVQFLLSLPLILHGGAVSMGERIFYSVFYILWGGLLFNMQWDTSGEIYIPYENSGGIWGKLFISGLIALVCLYISSAGIKAVARASLIAAAIGGVCLLLVCISALKSADWSNLGRADSGRAMYADMKRGIAMSGGLSGLAVFLPITKGDRFRTAAGYFTAKLILTAAVVLITVLVTGGIMDITEYPAVRAAQLSQLFPVQRIDSLFMIVFAVYAVFSIGIQAASAGYFIGELIPKAEKYAGAAALLLMTGAAFLLSGVSLYSSLTAVAVVTAVLAVPVISRVCAGLGKEAAKRC